MRRPDFLSALAGVALAGMSPRAVRAAVPDATKRVLWLRREGYSDDIVAPFSLDGRTLYVPGYRMICWAMRDRAVTPAQGYVRFDIVAIEALWEVQQALALVGIRRPLIVTSGYRTIQTNEAIEARPATACTATRKPSTSTSKASRCASFSTSAGRKRVPAESAFTKITFTLTPERAAGGPLDRVSADAA